MNIECNDASLPGIRLWGFRSEAASLVLPPPPYPKETEPLANPRRKRIADRSLHAWECRIGGNVVGRVGLRHDTRGAVSIRRFQIDPEWQHTAVAEKLMRCVRDYCAAHGCDEIAWEPGAAPGWVRSSSPVPCGRSAGRAIRLTSRWPACRCDAIKSVRPKPRSGMTLGDRPDRCVFHFPFLTLPASPGGCQRLPQALDCNTILGNSNTPDRRQLRLAMSTPATRIPLVSLLFAMHMANELLSVPVAGVTLGVAAVVVAIAARVARSASGDGRIPLMGVMGAFVFAAQMINFTLPGMPGTSGHLGGGVLLAILLGPAAGIVTMAAILIVQCLLFQDGGLLALGCNMLNMGVVPCLLGWGVYRVLLGPAIKAAVWRQYLAAWAACVLGVTAGAAMVPIEAAASGVLQVPAGQFLGVMISVHLVIALCEGAVTFAVVAYLRRVRPELLGLEAFGPESMGLVPNASPLASARPAMAPWPRRS